MDLTGITIGDRYIVSELLGEGGMSRVYKALDKTGGFPVAIKFMKEKVTSVYTEDIIRFKREIALIGKLDHPSIVKVLGAGEYENKPYIIMELLEGDNLGRLLADGTVFSPDDSLEILRQLAEALNYVHDLGIIHRDIKPANIMISRKQGEIGVKLLDFSISFIMELGEAGRRNDVTGTFGYMSPEAAGLLNRNADERSDLYSAGVVFYHLLAGFPPFKENDVGKLLHKQAARMPEKPSDVNKAVPVVFDGITMKLLEKDPDLRYQSTRGLLYDIGRYMNGERNFKAGEGDQKLKLTYQTRLVGRERQIDTISRMIEEAGSGNGGICLIGGEPGVGKSRLAEEVRNIVSRQDGLFIGGRCLNHSNKSPYQPFKDAVDEYIHKLENTDISYRTSETEKIKRSAGELGEILARFNPGMRRLLGSTKELVPLEPERETARFLLVLADFFLCLGETNRSCVLYLDDLQWADKGSLQLLREISSRIGNSNLLVLGTYRSNEVSEGHDLYKTISEIRSAQEKLVVKILEPFDIDQMRQLLECLLGSSNEDIDSLAEYTLSKSSGNPLLSISIVRELVENKAIVWKDGSWSEDCDSFRTVTLRGSMVDVILSRIDRLNEVQCELLCIGALIGREFDIELLYRLTEYDQEKVVDSVDAAVSLQLLESSGERGKLLFAHDRIRDAFYNKISPKDRKIIHRRIGEALEQSEPNDMENAVFELAHHFAEAGDEDKLLHYAVLAGEKAACSYANEDAIGYYQTADIIYERRNMKGCAEWLKINRCLVELYLVTGRNADAIRLSQTMLPYITDNLNKARINKIIGTAFFKQGDWTAAESYLVGVLQLLGEKMPGSVNMLLLRIALESVRHFFYTIFPVLFEFRGNVPVREEDRELARTLHFLSWSYILSDMKKFIYTEIRNFNLTLSRLDDCHEKMLAVAGYASFSSAMPLLRRKGLKYHLKCLQTRKRIGDIWGVAQSCQQIGFTYSWAGNNDDSLANFLESGKILKRIGDLWELGQAYHGAGLAYYYKSEYKQAESQFKEYLELSTRLSDYYGIGAAHAGLGCCQIETGDYTGALSSLDKARKVSKEHGIWFIYCYSLGYSGVAELETGNIDGAAKYLEEAKELYEKNFFLANYTVLLYPYLAALHVQKLKGDHSTTVSPDPKDKLGRERLDKAYDLCREALHRTGSYPNHYSAALRAMAACYALNGKKKAAERYFKKSISHADIRGRKYEAAKGCLEYGDYLSSQGCSEQAAKEWNKALGIFRSIGADVYIKRCFERLSMDTEEERGNLSRSRMQLERRSRIVFETGRYLSSILDTDQLLGKVLDSTMELVGAGKGMLLLYPEEGSGELEKKALRNISDDLMKADFPASRSIISKVIAEKKPLIASDADLDNEFIFQSTVMLEGMRSVMCAPIIAKGEVLGVIYLANDHISGLFNDEDLEVLDLISNQAAISIVNARLYGKLKQYSDEIEKSRSEIEQLNRMLEKKVEERTHELNSTMEELVRTQDELIQSSKMAAMGSLMARIAHEINTPIGNSLTAASHLLEKTGQIGEAFRNNSLTKTTFEKYVEKSEEAGKLTVFNLKRASDLVRSFKQVSADQASGVRREFAVREYIEEVLQGLLPDLQKTRHQLELDCRSELVVDSYPGAFSQIITNLVSNSLVHAFDPGTSGTIKIKAERQEDRLLIIYSDNGKGMEPDTLNRIFEPFFTTHSNGQGTGLGLNIVYNTVVKNLKGTIHCESEPGKGTVFNIEIPLKA